MNMYPNCHPSNPTLLCCFIRHIIMEANNAMPIFTSRSYVSGSPSPPPKDVNATNNPFETS